MTCSALERFAQVWLVDFEFRQPDGERPDPICMVAREYNTGRTLRLWKVELQALDQAPFDISPDALFVAFYASAELNCFLKLGWPLPVRILDLCIEFRCLNSGLYLPHGGSLVGAMTYYGLDCIEAADKESMRQLAMRGGAYTEAERQALLDYCESDVVALAKLLPVMQPRLDLPRALLRGRYMGAVSHMEHNGIPIDNETLESMRQHWDEIKDRLIARIDADYGIFEGRTFKRDRFTAWLAQNDMPWLQLDSGSLKLDDDTFKQMSRIHPEVAPIRELRHAMSELRLESLAVGSDGRNRCMLSAFSAKTGRNQPSTNRFIFGPSVWLRSLIKPESGYAVAYIDFEQQEFGIAAALSGDAAMMEAYQSGDPYLAFAKQAGAVPPDATKETHKAERSQFKVCSLAVQYGMGPQSLAQSLDQPEARARELLHLHRQTYPTFWSWSQTAVDHAMLHGWLHTVFGWRVHVNQKANPRSLANFPMQANGAEMLRLACCLATERDIKVCAPVHDALLIEAPLEAIDQRIAECQASMQEASEIVLDGFSLRSDAEIVRYPDRYEDARGKRMWETVMAILNELEPVATPLNPHCINATTPVAR